MKSEIPFTSKIIKENLILREALEYLLGKYVVHVNPKCYCNGEGMMCPYCYAKQALNSKK